MTKTLHLTQFPFHDDELVIIKDGMVQVNASPPRVRRAVPRAAVQAAELNAADERNFWNAAVAARKRDKVQQRKRLKNEKRNKRGS